MKKSKLFFLTTVALTIFSISTVRAQKGDIFAVGDNNLNIMLGVGSWYYDSYYHTSLPQFSVSFDHGLRDDWGPGVFGIGGFVSAATYKYDYYSYDEDYRSAEFNIAARATYHYQFFDKVDTYGGVLAGIKIRANNIPNNSDEGIYPVGSVFAGIKYYFTDNFSVMSELHAGNLAFFNIGIGLKF
jgi:hypothetical protein